MTRHDAQGFYRLQPDGKGYPGMTELLIDGRTYQASGTGPEVDAALRDAAKERGRLDG